MVLSLVHLECKNKKNKGNEIGRKTGNGKAEGKPDEERDKSDKDKSVTEASGYDKNEHDRKRRHDRWVRNRRKRQSRRRTRRRHRKPNTTRQTRATRRPTKTPSMETTTRPTNATTRTPTEKKEKTTRKLTKAPTSKPTRTRTRKQTGNLHNFSPWKTAAITLVGHVKLRTGPVCLSASLSVCQSVCLHACRSVFLSLTLTTYETYLEHLIIFFSDKSLKKLEKYENSIDVENKTQVYVSHESFRPILPFLSSTSKSILYFLILQDVLSIFTDIISGDTTTEEDKDTIANKVDVCITNCDHELGIDSGSPC